jgi:hypothetical protein
MAGTTQVQGFPYPFINEAATPVSLQNLADQVDAKLDAKDAARITALTRPSVRVIRSAGSVSVAINTPTTQTYDTEEFDTGGFANLGVNNDRIIIPTTGLYYIYGGALGVSIGTATVVEASLARNGTQFARNKEKVSDDHDRWVNVSAVKTLTAADFIQVLAFWTGSAGPYPFTNQYLAARLIAT